MREKTSERGQKHRRQKPLIPNSGSSAEASGEKIPNVAELAGTSLDKGVELDALAQLPPDKRDELIADASAGKKVGAKHLVGAVKAAKTIGVSVSDVQSARVIREEGPPELSAAIMDCKVSFETAERIVHLADQEQKPMIEAIIAKGPEKPTRQQDDDLSALPWDDRVEITCCCRSRSR